MKFGGEIYDMIGIGFGPANLALAVACEESASEPPLRRLFLEAKSSFVWHPGMLIEDSLLQITVLKDLILVENPCSRFTFLNYLKEKGRLYEFLNLRDLYPTRIEFNDYLCWVADQLAARVRYGQEVVGIVPLGRDGEREAEDPAWLQVETRDAATGEHRRFVARHVVLAAGGRPQLPPGIELEPDGRAFHSSGFKARITAFAERDARYRFVVVGGGQSGGEIFDHLIDRYPRADVTATVRGFSYKPVDDSDFTNQIFFPEWVDYFHSLPEDKRRRLFSSLRDVNYAAIDSPLIHRIYTKLYRQKVEGRVRARLTPFMELRDVREKGSAVELEFRQVMEERKVVLEADAAVLCTGFSWPKEHPLLSRIERHLERDEEGGYRVGRDYRVVMKKPSGPGLYLQGYCERTHGISETVLSLLPVRAAKILRSVQAACREQHELVTT